MPEPMQDSLSAQVINIFRRTVKKKYRDRVGLEAELQADLDMDSLAILSTMLSAEGELGVTIFPLQADVAEIRTVGDIVRVIRTIQEQNAVGG